MESAAQYHAVIDEITVWSGMSDKFLHVHAGLAIFILAQVAMRNRRASFNALLAVFLLEACNEAMDRLYSGSWRWNDTVGDAVATMFWPTMIVLLGRYRRARWSTMLKRQQDAQKKMIRSAFQPAVRFRDARIANRSVRQAKFALEALRRTAPARPGA